MDGSMETRRTGTGDQRSSCHDQQPGRKSGLVISGGHQVAEIQTYFILQVGVNTGLGDQAIQKRGDWMMSEDEYVNLLLCKWGGSVKHDQESISKIWVESRKVCERDAAPAWNTLIAKYPDGKASGQDADWMHRALAQLWYENDCLNKHKTCFGELPEQQHQVREQRCVYEHGFQQCHGAARQDQQIRARCQCIH